MLLPLQITLRLITFLPNLYIAAAWRREEEKVDPEGAAN